MALGSTAPGSRRPSISQTTAGAVVVHSRIRRMGLPVLGSRTRGRDGYLEHTVLRDHLWHWIPCIPGYSPRKPSESAYLRLFTTPTRSITCPSPHGATAR